MILFLPVAMAIINLFTKKMHIINLVPTKALSHPFCSFVVHFIELHKKKKGRKRSEASIGKKGIVEEAKSSGSE